MYWRTTLTAALSALALMAVAACSGETTVAPGSDVSDVSDGAEGSGADSGSPDAGPTGDTTEPDTESGVCGYPMSTGFNVGDVLPALVWENAYLADGTRFTLDLEEVHCSEEWADVDTLHFVITTGWCPNCPNYIAYVDSLGAQIEEAGGRVIFLTTEDRSGALATSEYANEHTSQYAEAGVGIRVGDADSDPAGAFAASGVIEFVPTSLVVRRSDMRVIADQRSSEYTLPFVEIAREPALDWSSPGAPGVLPETPSNCGPDDEEIYEPNNRPGDAPSIGATTFEGGVCDTNPDFYYVDIPGRWSVYLGFDHEVGDLDAYVWDLDRQRPLVDELGEEIGSYTANDDEYFEYVGPAYLYVVGYGRATAPYTLVLTAL